jgi:hypothetical protein
MNVKLASHEIIFKITEAELYALESTKRAVSKLMLGGMTMVTEIVVLDTIEKSVLHLSTDRAEACISLSVTPFDIRSLKDKGKDRFGLTWPVNGTSVSLQVDLKTDTRSRNTL